MFMVDGVELVFPHQEQQMREFHGDHPAGLQYNFHAGNKVIKIRHVGKHIIAQQEVSVKAFRCQLGGGFNSEKGNSGGYSLFLCYSGNIFSGFLAWLQRRQMIAQRLPPNLCLNVIRVLIVSSLNTRLAAVVGDPTSYLKWTSQFL